MRTMLGVITLVSALLTGMSQGGHYKLSTLIYSGIGRMMDPVLSENMPLCQAYARNLNSYAPLSSPMVCERLLNPVFPEFSRPPWQTLNPQDHVALIKQMDLLLFYRWQPENFQEQQWMERLKQDLATNQIKLRLARLDVVASGERAARPPDGIPENLIEYDYRRACDPTDERWLSSHGGGISYFIVNDNLTEIQEFTGIPRPSGVFLYQGHVYFDALSTSNFDETFTRPLKRLQYEVYVLKPFGGVTVPICRYRYVGPVPIRRKLP